MPAPTTTSLDSFRTPGVDRAETFAERGVAVPFTTPMLAGARIRRAPDAETPELVLPALGGRGHYVLGWDACTGLSKPTLHDRQLWDRLAVLPLLAPAGVRAAARAVAAQGFAGRAAQAAAVAALQALTAARGEAQRRLAVQLAPLLGLPGAARRMHDLSAGLAEAGTGGLPGAPVAARIAGLEELAAIAAAVAVRAPDDAERVAAMLVAAAARLTLGVLTCTVALLGRALAQLPAAFAEGDAAVARLILLAERPDWLLDGWAPLAALVAATPAEARGAALRDALATLPILPREADGWSAANGAWDTLGQAQSRLAGSPGWSRAPRAEAVRRLEAMRARAA
jgi:hypothetical protein